jgi:O-antigen ligase
MFTGNLCGRGFAKGRTTDGSKRMNIFLRNCMMSLLFVPFLKPETVGMFPVIDSIFNVCRIISAFIILLMYMSRGKTSKIMAYIITLSFVFFLSTWLNRGDLEQCFKTYTTIVVFGMLIEIEVCRDVLSLLRCLRRLLALFVFVNFISILLFPDGFYILHAGFLSTGWFLGYKNSIMTYILPCICVSLLYAHFTAGRITNGTAVILAISVYSIIHVWSAVSLVGIFIVVFFITIIYKHNFSAVFNMRNYLIVVTIFFVLVIVLGVQRHFSFFIEQILDKDLTFTGRTDIWEKAIFYITQFPVIGSGIEYFELIQTKIGESSTHDMYLEIMYRGGVVALLVFLAIIYAVSKRLNHRKRSEFVNILSCVIFAYLAMVLAESFTTNWFIYGMFVLAYHVDKIIEQHAQYTTRRNLQQSQLKLKLRCGQGTGTIYGSH